LALLTDAFEEASIDSKQTSNVPCASERQPRLLDGSSAVPLKVDVAAQSRFVEVRPAEYKTKAEENISGGEIAASRENVTAADVAAELLTDRDAICVLIDAGLLTAADVVAGQLQIIRTGRRNHSFVVEGPGGSGFFVKQARIPASADTLRNEANVLRSAATACRAELTAYMPRLLHYDPVRNILVTKLLSGGSFGRSPASIHELTQYQITSLGRAIATVHCAALSGISAAHGVALGVSLYRPSLSLYRDSSRANIHLLAAIQRSDRLCDQLSTLDHSWRPSDFIHGDVKLDNLILRNGDCSETLVLVDWELARLGDPRWDVGSALGELLQLWLVDSVRRDLAPSVPSEGEHLGTRAFHQIRRLATALFDGYRQAASKPISATFIADCFGFSAARLLQTAFEAHQFRIELDLFAVKAIQMAANIATHRDVIVEIFLGKGARP
jgi:hypothetical protein